MATHFLVKINDWDHDGGNGSKMVSVWGVKHSLWSYASNPRAPARDCFPKFTFIWRVSSLVGSSGIRKWMWRTSLSVRKRERDVVRWHDTFSRNKSQRGFWRFFPLENLRPCFYPAHLRWSDSRRYAEISMQLHVGEDSTEPDKWFQPSKSSEFGVRIRIDSVYLVVPWRSHVGQYCARLPVHWSLARRLRFSGHLSFFFQGGKTHLTVYYSISEWKISWIQIFDTPPHSF